MKYMILTYGSQQDYDGMAGKATDLPAWTPEDFAAMGAFMTDLNRRLTESGELVEGRALAAPVHTRRVQNGPAGRPVVTDGPYAETTEVLAGYWIVECDSFDWATEIASRVRRLPGAGARPGHRGRRRTADRRVHRGRRLSDDRPVAEDLLRRLAPEVLGALVRRHGQFATAEDAVQEALLQAAEDWRRHGVPENPRAWLLTVASRRMTDLLRAEQARRRREEPATASTFLARGRRSRRRCPADRPGRQPDPALPVLPPVARADGPDRAHPPGGRRVDHGGDRPGLPGLRGHHDPADHPGEQTVRDRRPVLAA